MQCRPEKHPTSFGRPAAKPVPVTRQHLTDSRGRCSVQQQHTQHEQGQVHGAWFTLHRPCIFKHESALRDHAGMYVLQCRLLKLVCTLQHWWPCNARTPACSIT